ncbi:MAG: S8 family serine peptidase [Candidatus Dormibacteria bacterium]
MTISTIRLQRPVALQLSLVLALAGFGLLRPASPAHAAPANPAVSQFMAANPGQPVPVIIQTAGDPVSLTSLVTTLGGNVQGTFTVLHAVSASVPAAAVGALMLSTVVNQVDLNPPMWLTGTPNVDAGNLANRYDTLSRVPAAWSTGLDGTGVQVAVLDTGVWPHDDLMVDPLNPGGQAGFRLMSVVTNPSATDAFDHYGHGTHVAGILAGNGYDSGGQYIGVAPRSLLVGVKISDDLGRANTADVIAGLEWVYLANQRGFHIRVVNLSLNSTYAESYRTSALDAMVEMLWRSGVLVVVAAGNGDGAVNYPPANDPFALTVGSIDDDYTPSLGGATMMSGTRYGTTQDGFNKPEVVADGSHVVSLLAPGSVLSGQHPANVVGQHYFKMGGSSMAAPIVAGLAALTYQANPLLTNDNVKTALSANSVPFGSTAWTSWLGTAGGFVDEAAVTNASGGSGSGPAVTTPSTPTLSLSGLTYSSTNVSPAITLPNTVPVNTLWSNTGWSNTGWSNTGWSNTGWSNTGWSNTGWSNTGWSNTGWSNTGWSNTGWSNTGWSNTGWSNTGWSNTGWSNTGWSNTGWSNTGWSNTGWSDSGPSAFS